MRAVPGLGSRAPAAVACPPGSRCPPAPQPAEGFEGAIRSGRCAVGGPARGRWGDRAVLLPLPQKPVRPPGRASRGGGCHPRDHRLRRDGRGLLPKPLPRASGAGKGAPGRTQLWEAGSRLQTRASQPLSSPTRPVRAVPCSSQGQNDRKCVGRHAPAARSPGICEGLCPLARLLPVRLPPASRLSWLPSPPRPSQPQTPRGRVPPSPFLTPR